MNDLHISLLECLKCNYCVECDKFSDYSTFLLPLVFECLQDKCLTLLSNSEKCFSLN